MTLATGTAERSAALEIAANKRNRSGSHWALRITPLVTQNDTNRASVIDGRTTWHEGYAVSQRKRKRVENVFGWMKTVALQRKTKFRGIDRVG